MFFDEVEEFLFSHLRRVVNIVFVQPCLDFVDRVILCGFMVCRVVSASSDFGLGCCPRGYHGEEEDEEQPVEVVAVPFVRALERGVLWLCGGEDEVCCRCGVLCVSGGYPCCGVSHSGASYRDCGVVLC